MAKKCSFGVNNSGFSICKQQSGKASKDTKTKKTVSNSSVNCLASTNTKTQTKAKTQTNTKTQPKAKTQTNSENKNVSVQFDNKSTAKNENKDPLSIVKDFTSSMFNKSKDIASKIVNMVVINKLDTEEEVDSEKEEDISNKTEESEVSKKEHEDVDKEKIAKAKEDIEKGIEELEGGNQYDRQKVVLEALKDITTKEELEALIDEFGAKVFASLVLEPLLWQGNETRNNLRLLLDYEIDESYRQQLREADSSYDHQLEVEAEMSQRTGERVTMSWP